MKHILLLPIVLLLAACATQQPPEFPANQAVGLSDQQGGALEQAMKNKGALLYGQNYFYNLSTPTGWVLDNSAGVGQGLDAVFYEKGGNWATATTVMYPQVWQKEGKQLSAIVADDIAQYKAHFPTLAITDEPPIKTKNGQKAELKYFSGGARNQFEAIAYFDEPRVVVMVVFQAPTQEAFKKAYPAFVELVRSYIYLGDSPPAIQGS